MNMEEVNKLLKCMVNDLTKVKQGLVAHSFVGKEKNKTLRNQPQFIRSPHKALLVLSKVLFDEIKSIPLFLVEPACTNSVKSD